HALAQVFLNPSDAGCNLLVAVAVGLKRYRIVAGRGFVGVGREERLLENAQIAAARGPGGRQRNRYSCPGEAPVGPVHHGEPGRLLVAVWMQQVDGRPIPGAGLKQQLVQAVEVSKPFQKDSWRRPVLLAQERGGGFLESALVPLILQGP